MGALGHQAISGVLADVQLTMGSVVCSPSQGSLAQVARYVVGIGILAVRITSSQGPSPVE